MRCGWLALTITGLAAAPGVVRRRGGAQTLGGALAAAALRLGVAHRSCRGGDVLVSRNGAELRLRLPGGGAVYVFRRGDGDDPGGGAPGPWRSVATCAGAAVTSSAPMSPGRGSGVGRCPGAADMRGPPTCSSADGRWAERAELDRGARCAGRRSAVGLTAMPPSSARPVGGRPGAVRPNRARSPARHAYAIGATGEPGAVSRPRKPVAGGRGPLRGRPGRAATCSSWCARADGGRGPYTGRAQAARGQPGSSRWKTGCPRWAGTSSASGGTLFAARPAARARRLGL